MSRIGGFVIKLVRIKAVIMIILAILIVSVVAFLFLYNAKKDELYLNKNNYIIDTTIDENETKINIVEDNSKKQVKDTPEYREANKFANNPNYKGRYRIDVNRLANTVTIYERDSNGLYNTPIKAMVCSTGPATPLGDYYMPSRRQEIGELYGNVWGIYVSDIVGDILFHSVPADQPKSNRIIGEEYNKLGTSASMGCVRLSVPDAKWIMENAEVGTWVHFYDDEIPGPLGKPVPLKMEEDFGIDPNYK